MLNLKNKSLRQVSQLFLGNKYGLRNPGDNQN